MYVNHALQKNLHIRITQGERAMKQEVTFWEALRIIRTDRTSFQGYSKKGTLTKKEVYTEVFGKEARKGATRVIDGQEQRTPGYYEQYSFLSRREINGILKAHIQNLATATVVMHVKPLLDGDLRRAHVQARKSVYIRREKTTSKTSTKDAPPPTQEETSKLHIKQAKQEAKLMLKIEQTKQRVQKAERKVQKAQSHLEDSLTRLRTLEEELMHVRSQAS
jgi:hypothetical protein